MKENILKTKSLLFAIRVVNLYKFLCEDKKEYILSKQILRSGTSVGAMVRESEFSESNIDFIHKLAIAQKKSTKPYFGLNYYLKLSLSRKISLKASI